MSLAEVYEKIAALDQEPEHDYDQELEKVATFYDELGRGLFHAMEKQARKLPPGMFSGKKGLLKLLGGTAAVGGSYAYGKSKGKAEHEGEDVEMADRAYKAGVQRGAQLVIQRLRAMGG